MHSFASAVLFSAIFSASHLAAQNTDTSTTSPSSGISSNNSSGGLSGLVSGLSSSCQAAAGSLLSSEFGGCSNIIGLVSVLGARGSVVPALNNWISGVCSVNPCSTSILSSAQSSVDSGCGDDVSKSVPAAISLSTIVSNYNVVRNLLCTQYTSNGSFCVPSILGNVQMASGTNVSISQVQGVLTQGSAALTSMLSSIPTTAYCVDCGKAIFVETAAIKTTGTSTNATAASGSLSDKCGASFGDGKLPSTVRIAGNGTAADAKNNSAGQQTPCHFMGLALAAFVGWLML